MVSYDQLKKGVITFLNRELIEKMSSLGRIGANSVIYIVEKKSDTIFNNLKKNQLLLSSEIINNEGMIDDDLILEAIKNGMGDEPINFDTGIFGVIKVSKNDIDLLHKYINS